MLIIPTPLKILAALAILAVSISIPYHCINPSNPEWWDEPPYLIVELLGILDLLILSFFVTVILWQYRKKMMGFGNILFIAATVRLIALLCLREIGKYAIPAYATLLQTDPVYACETLPNSLLTAYWFF